MAGYLLVIFSGLCSAVGASAYRYAAKGKVSTVQLMTFLGFAGALFFGIVGWKEWAALPQFAVWGSLAGGITQYLTIRVLRVTLKLGPLSPSWCSISLGAFIPVIVIASLFWQEPLSIMQIFSLLATGGAIFFASRGTDGEKKLNGRTKLLYAGCLVLLLVLSSVLNVFLKYCTRLPGTLETKTLLDSNGHAIMAIVYGAMFLGPALELLLTRTWVNNHYTWVGGLILSAGALANYAIMLTVMHLPAILVFALGNTTSIIGVALISTLCFREKRTAAWYLMLAFSILAILLNR